MDIIAFDTSCSRCGTACTGYTSTDWYTPEELKTRRSVRCPACRHRGLRGLLMAPRYLLIGVLAHTLSSRAFEPVARLLQHSCEDDS